MAKYIIKHGQFYEIPDDTLIHHKYVKREKVGDKWKYYYSWDEVKQNSATKSVVSGVGKTVAEAAKKVTSSKTNSSSNNKKSTSNDDLDKIVDKVIRGDYGNGKERVKKLSEAGYDSAEVQKLVNRKLKSGSKKSNTETTNDDAKKTETTNDDAKKTSTKKSPTDEELDKIANKVIRGDYGNGRERVEKLSKAGYDSAVIQNLVNKKLKSSSKQSTKKTSSTKATKRVNDGVLMNVAKEAVSTVLNNKR